MTTTNATGSHSIPRYFTTSDIYPYDAITWETRDAKIIKANGDLAFFQPNIKVPAFWSETASTIVASKYFRGQLANAERESSVKQMINRVVKTITIWGREDGYFANADESYIFEEELTHIIVNQMASFNSPVWFNIGCTDREQQASACYILSVEDSMPGILEWYRQEALIFSRGSGAGINISSLRAEGEPISKGGVSSGPLSFMRAADASAFSIKSGGTTRRSARMVVMDVDHPDIIKFIWAKAREEQKARVLTAAGYDSSIDGEIYGTVAHQNCNMSVGVTDDFLHKALHYEMWCTKNRTSYEGQEHKAENILRAMASACHQSGDPGLFFLDTVNAWHTTPAQGRIVSSNPCAEFIRPPNEACNLACINLLKYLKDDNSFDIEAFCHTADVLITAQEILVGRADYPTPAITKNSHDYRTLGLGYSNLGALLMAKGLPYDSEEGRDYAASITALMTGQAYKRSAELAAMKGPFAGYEANKEPMMDVMLKHIDAIGHLVKSPVALAARNVWDTAISLGNEHGYRNAQVSLLMPGGTVSLMMDCATTGVEPDVGLVNYKKLVGGGTIKKVSPIVERALKTLGYNGTTAEILKMIETDGGPYSIIRQEHARVFDCAFPATPGGRAISWLGHVKMVAAVQPFLSGGISKTINMPKTATVEDIEEAFLIAWKLGCKSIAIYRDGCKQTQVLTTQQTSPSIGDIKPPLVAALPLDVLPSIETPVVAKGGSIPARKRLPDERPAITHKFSVGGQEGYFTVGLYEDGSPAELFVHIAKEGSTLGGVMDAWATLLSFSLQYGVPLEALTSKLRNARYEPMGFTTHQIIRSASSLTDYIMQWLEWKFLNGCSPNTPILPTQYEQGATQTSNVGSDTLQDKSGLISFTVPQNYPPSFQSFGSALCTECGGITKKTGSCYVCTVCGNSGGCS